MTQFWYKPAGIIVDDIGVVLCAICPCSPVQPGCGCDDVPDYVVVTISGVANGSGCTDCDTIINGEFEVPITYDSLNNLCSGIIKMPGPDCFDYPTTSPGNFWIRVDILDQGSPNIRYEIKIADGDSPESFRRYDVTNTDCCNHEGDAPEYFGPVKDCDWSVATVNVRSVCL
jgi:hypothetical protein